MKNKAVLIMPYFGRLPAYFGTYLASLKNKRFDVIWISGLSVAEHPDNFKIVRMTFDELKVRVAERLGTPVCINGGRRLCDFKPMYGQIFEDLIADYDYWAFGDCDLVYGEAINDFITDTVEPGAYDVVSVQKTFLSGPLCFFRNDARMRALFQKARNWKEVCLLKGTECLQFDECGGEFHEQLKTGEMTLEDCSRIHDSFSAVVWRGPDLKIYRETVISQRLADWNDVVTMSEDGHLS